MRLQHPSSTPHAAHGRRRVITRLCAGTLAALATALTLPVQAQATYPNKPIRLVIGYPPGGSNDIVARIVTPLMGEILGQQLVVENRPGANGTMGAASVAKSSADGYTLLLTSASPLVIAPHLMPKRPFDVMRDFQPVGLVGLTPEAIAVGPSLPVKSFQEMLELARRQDITIASSGNGGLPHLTIELLKRASKGRITHVPYKGGGPAVADTVAGHVNAVTMDLPALIAFVRDGRLKALAVTSEKRVDFLPDVPTAAEQGLPSFEAVNWLGIFAPAGTPTAVVNTLHAAINKAVADPRVREQLNRAAVVSQTSADSAAFTAFVSKENERWGKVARETGASLD